MKAPIKDLIYVTTYAKQYKKGNKKKLDKSMFSPFENVHEERNYDKNDIITKLKCESEDFSSQKRGSMVYKKGAKKDLTKSHYVKS